MECMYFQPFGLEMYFKVDFRVFGPNMTQVVIEKSQNLNYIRQLQLSISFEFDCIKLLRNIGEYSQKFLKCHMLSPRPVLSLKIHFP